MSLMKALGGFFSSVILPKTDKLDLTEASQGIAQQVVNKRSKLEEDTIRFKAEQAARPKPVVSADWLGGGMADYRRERQEHIDRYNPDGSFKDQYLQQPVVDPTRTSEAQVKASIDQWHKNAERKRRIVSETHPAFPSPFEDEEEFERRRVAENKERARLAKEKKRRDDEEAEAQRQIRELEALEAQAAYAENPKFGQF